VSKNYEIASIKSYSLKLSSNANPNMVQFPKKISFDFKFFSQNYSIFNSSCTIGLNMTKPPLCTPTHCEGFPMVPRVGGRGGWGTIIWEISTQQTKKTRGVPHRGLAI
jgi:hypothetical protein